MTKKDKVIEAARDLAFASRYKRADGTPFVNEDVAFHHLMATVASAIDALNALDATPDESVVVECYDAGGGSVWLRNKADAGKLFRWFAEKHIITSGTRLRIMKVDP